MADDQNKQLTGPDLNSGVAFSKLEDNQPLLGHYEGEPVILVRRGDEIFATSATCTHYSGPLAEGLVVGETVRCPWHHARFDLRTGEAIGAPALKPDFLLRSRAHRRQHPNSSEKGNRFSDNLPAESNLCRDRGRGRGGERMRGDAADQRLFRSHHACGY
jgi:nitrite reductase/ring-hydroxylating ferredoxin subunit